MNTSTQKSWGVVSRHPWLALTLGLLVVVVIPVYSIVKMTGSKPATQAEWVTAKSGDQIEVTIEITETISGTTAKGTLLETSDSRSYGRTARTIDIQLAPDTRIVMGKRENIHPGAVVQVKGRVGANQSVEAERVVILTGFVQIN